MKDEDKHEVLGRLNYETVLASQQRLGAVGNVSVPWDTLTRDQQVGWIAGADAVWRAASSTDGVHTIPVFACVSSADDHPKRMRLTGVRPGGLFSPEAAVSVRARHQKAMQEGDYAPVVYEPLEDGRFMILDGRVRVDLARSVDMREIKAVRYRD